MLLELMQKRRSIRRFDRKPVEKEKLDILLETVLRSPSSRGLTPWQFVVVQDRDMLKTLSSAKPHGASFLADAGVGIVICADPGICDVWIEDCSIAAFALHLAATDLGLGSCWIQIRKRAYDDSNNEMGAEDFVRNRLGLDPAIRVLAVLAIGYPAEEKKGHACESLPFDRIRYV